MAYIGPIDIEIAQMSVAPAPTEPTQPFDTRQFWRFVLAGLALLTIAGGLFWMRFGSLIFFDMLSALQGCF